MKPFIILLFIIVPVLAVSSQVSSSFVSGSTQIPFQAANVTDTSTTTTVLTVTSSSTTLQIQTYTIQTTVYSTTHMQSVNVTMTQTVTSSTTSLATLTGLTSITNTFSSNTTSISTIVVPHFQQEWLTSDVLTLLMGGIAAFFGVVAVAWFYYRRNPLRVKPK